MNKNIIKLVAVSIFTFYSCRNNSVSYFTVKGNFKTNASNTIMLAEFPFGEKQRIIVDSTTLDNKGNFELKTIQKTEGMYQLFVKNGPGVLLINDAETITINADENKLEAFTAQGSAASNSIKKLFELVANADSLVKKENAQLLSIAKVKVKDSVRLVYQTNYDASVKNLKDIFKAYNLNEKNATACWFGLGVAQRYLSKDEWTELMKQSYKKFPMHAGIALMNKLNKVIEAAPDSLKLKMDTGVIKKDSLIK